MNPQTQAAIAVQEKTIANCAYAYGRLSAFAVAAAEAGNRNGARMFAKAARSELRVLLSFLGMAPVNQGRRLG